MAKFRSKAPELQGGFYDELSAIDEVSLRNKARAIAEFEEALKIIHNGVRAATVGEIFEILQAGGFEEVEEEEEYA